jgi:ABC-2 type transport system permease protein
MSATAVSAEILPEPDFGAGTPFARLVRVELRKTVDTRAGRWLLIAIAAITVLAVTLFLIFGPEEELDYANMLGIAATPQGFLLPVLGILAVTSEWSQRTGLVTFTLEPHRGRVLSAKVVAVLLLGLLFVALLLGSAALANLLADATRDGAAATWNFGFDDLGRVLLLQSMGLLGGIAFGMILLHSASAIVLAFVLPLATGILFGIVPAIEDAGPWIDLGTAQAPLFEFDQTISATEWMQLLVTSIWWIVLPSVAGVFRVLRSELKSA